MELTGECREDFKNWFYKGVHLDYTGLVLFTDANGSPLDIFNELPNSSKWGVYVDFFDSKDYEIAARREGGNYIWFVGLSVNNFYINTKPSLSEARGVAIKRANELYNNA